MCMLYDLFPPPCTLFATCVSKATSLANSSCKRPRFCVLPAGPHTNPAPFTVACWTLTDPVHSGAEKHIEFTTLISLTQSISWLVSHPAHHPVIQAAGLPFLEHFRWVFGCEWALGMRFEEDYQGPESCLGASCAFQQNCCCPRCISVGKMWCVSFPLSLRVSLIR